jgi:hypothetical protein
MGPPDDNDGRRLTQPTPATTPTAATTPEISVILPGQVDDDAAEAAEQLSYEIHLAELCPDDCPWCEGRWSA